jgi:hypothetical protein
MDQPSTSNVLVGIAGESPPATSAAQASTALQICLSSRVLPVLDDTEADTPSGGKMDFVESVVDRGIALALRDLIRGRIEGCHLHDRNAFAAAFSQASRVAWPQVG